MRLLRIPEPFDRPGLFVRTEYDGFRCLAFLDDGRCDLVSRNGHVFESWPTLERAIVAAVRAIRAGSARPD